MHLEDVERAVNEAREQMRLVDRQATSMAQLLRGRLRHVNSPAALKELKMELRNYNAHTGEWRQSK